MKINMAQRGKFIVIDGVDGSGKGTQVKLLAGYLFDQNKANHVFLTREPYRSRYYQQIRRILKKSKNPKDHAELLAKLFVQDRRVHARIIQRNLLEGNHAVSDRYKYSTLAYQQAQGIPFQKLVVMHRGILVPDLVLIIDVPVEVALRRIVKDMKGGKRYKEVFEQREFQEKLRRNILALKRQLPKERIVIINGNQTREKVFSAIKKEVDKLF